jgi:hypothetical protein
VPSSFVLMEVTMGTALAEPATFILDKEKNA